MSGKRLLCAALAAAFALCALGLWAGAQKEGTAAAAGTGAAALQWRDGDRLDYSLDTMTQKIALPLAKEKKTLHIMAKHYGRGDEKEDFNQYRNFRLLEQKTNVHVNWEVIARQQYGPVHTTALATGENMPDIVNFEGGDALAVDLAEAGIIIPLDKLIAQYAPDIKNVFDIWPWARKMTTFTDGNHYVLPKLASGKGWVIPYSWKKAWMDKLNLQPPKTVADWEKAFQAVVNGDPNGNGKRDETGFSSYDGNLFPYYAGMYWFGIKHGFGTGDFQTFEKSSEPTKVKYKYTTQNMKDTITWLRKAYQEEWFERAAIDDPANWGKKQDKKDTITGRSGWLPTYKDPKVDPEFYSSSVILDPWKDFYGNQTLAPSNTGFWSSSLGWVVTKDCKDPVLAIQYLDYLYGTREGTLLYQFGEEGVDYEWRGPAMKDESLYFFYEDNEKPAKAKSDPIYFMDEMTWIVPTSWNSKYNMATNSMFQQIWDKWQASFHIPVAWPIMNKQEKLLYNNFKLPATFINDEMRKFITGQQPMENWNVFTSQLQKFGVQYGERAIQMAADRFAKF